MSLTDAADQLKRGDRQLARLGHLGDLVIGSPQPLGWARPLRRVSIRVGGNYPSVLAWPEVDRVDEVA